MITLRNLTLRRGVKVLLDDASATINPGERVGVVGRNGAGKSSLFALLNGRLHEDGGECTFPPHWRIAQVAQDMPETAQNATDFVVEGDAGLCAARAEIAAAEAAHDNERLAHAYLLLQDASAHDAAARAQALILGLGFKVAELDQPVNSFSGGWRMRLQLARALMCPSELLLLDEPTNHLDLDALVWLEAWLKKYEGTLLVISHDREFLDAVTTVTLHIEGGKLQRYGGNYSTFEDLRATQMALQQAAYNRQQERMAHLQKFIDRFKAKATKARQAQSRVKALARMEKIAPLLSESEFSISFQEPANLPNPMLVLQGVSVGYPHPQPEQPPITIVRKISKSVLAGQRIGILGANGQGKSTLVKTIARTLQPIEGRITEGKGLSIGYFAQQELDVLRADDSPLAHMTRLARELGQEGRLSGQAVREQDLRGYLGSFQFSGDMVLQAVGTMSGGEKARLVLCMIVWQRPNLLLLDEPTNHLDLHTREALALALNAFDGTLMLVSHDRALLRAVCDEFWLVSRAGVQDFDGDLDDYQRYLLEEARRAREQLREAGRSSRPAPAPVAAPITAKSRADTSPKTRKEYQEVEARMAQLTETIARLETRMGQALDHAELAAAGRQLTSTQEELVLLEERWLELTELLGL